MKGKIIEIKDTKVIVKTKDDIKKIIPKSKINFNYEVGMTIKIIEKVTDYEVINPHKVAGMNNGREINGIPEYLLFGSKSVNKTKYCLLIIFLGGLGFHHFYVKKYKKGLLYLLFFWTLIPFILAFIDFTHVIAIEEDSFGNIII